MEKTALLPDYLQESDYWQSIYKQPLGYWQATLDMIALHHHLSAAAWVRFSSGKNIVFACGEVVIKISPPFWREDLWNEVEALQFVNGRLPVTTPDVIATGEIGQWGYLIMSRAVGESMRQHWTAITPAERVILARQHGEIMAALHALPVAGQVPRLQGDWNTPMLEYQMANCEAALRQAGVPEALLTDLAGYLSTAQPLLAADTRWVLLHGDLDAGNMNIERREDGWHISALIDWGDVRLGPITHEFISPCVHSYKGEQAALRAWYAGYGLQGSAALEHNLMARTMLYYADEFATYLNHVPGAAACQRWEQVASFFWHMR